MSSGYDIAPALIFPALLIGAGLAVVSLFWDPDANSRPAGTPKEYVQQRDIFYRQDVAFLEATNTPARRMHNEAVARGEAQNTRGDLVRFYDQARVAYIQTTASELYFDPDAKVGPFYSGAIDGVMNNETREAIARACDYALARLGGARHGEDEWMPRLATCAPDHPQRIRDDDEIVQAAFVVRYAERMQHPYTPQRLMSGGAHRYPYE